VLLTTGIRLRGDAAAQRELVAEAAAKPLTAIGFGVGVIFRSVPAALLDEAERRNFPLFTIAPETPFREIVGFVERSLASDDFRVLRRRITIESSLADALASEDPEEALVRRLGSLIEASVILYGLDGRVATSIGAAPREAIWQELAGDPSRTRFEVGRWGVVAEPVLTGQEVRRWLIVATRRRSLSEELVVDVVHSAARLLGVVDLVRDATRADDRTLRAELLDQLLDPVRGAYVPHERLASCGFNADRELRVALLESRRWASESAGPRASDTGRAARLVEMAAEESRCPCLVAVRRGRLTIVFQERERDVEDWTARLSAQGVDLIVGVGRPFSSGGGGALESMRDAELALEHLRHVAPAADGRGRSLRFEGFGLADWLLASADARTFETKAEISVAALRANPELFRTLLAYLDCDLEVPRTARRLHLHENSLRYRLRRIETILGRSLRELPTIVDLHLATVAERAALGSGLGPAVSSFAGRR
jgi:purine catabolism regulator